MVPLDVASSFIHATIYPTLISFSFLHFANIFSGVPIWKKKLEILYLHFNALRSRDLFIFLASIDFILHVRNGLLPSGK